MHLENLRIKIVKHLVIASVIVVVFFLFAPETLGFPIDSGQSHVIIQLLIPVFIGYLSMAVSFPGRPAMSGESYSALNKIHTIGNYAFALTMVIGIARFWYTNRPFSSPASGMTFHQLTYVITFAICILNATIGAMVTRLFKE